MLERKAIHGLSTYMVIGAIIGLLIAALLFGTEALFSWSSAREHAVALLKNSGGPTLVAIAYATIASAGFWLIAVRPPR
ncbi:MAG: hypothetical protein JSS86_00160 [Cyanobacteria bacterium SZAS LIN-2]|nr:hypothetical protein [Cyanobacteria bacterium SZAS LIN-2]